MKRLASNLRSVLPGLLACALLAAPAARAGDYENGEHEPYGSMVVDGLLVRPLGLVATVGGAALWVVTLPFSALGGNAGEAADALVVDPARFTFVRPLGDL